MPESRRWTPSLESSGGLRAIPLGPKSVVFVPHPKLRRRWRRAAGWRRPRVSRPIHPDLSAEPVGNSLESSGGLRAIPLGPKSVVFVPHPKLRRRWRRAAGWRRPRVSRPIHPDLSAQPVGNSRHLFICAVLLFIPTAAQAAADHSRPAMSLAEESAWLDHLVANSVHRQALQAAASAGPALPVVPVAANPLAPPPPPAKAWPAKKGRRCYGFLPYWTASGAILHWEELTQVAWFSAELNSAGNFTNLHGWGGAAAKQLIGQAHSHGVQVPLTITLFSKSGISAVLATASKRTALVGKIADLVISGGGDGVNIDFEGLALADRDNMKAFVAELNTTMKKKLPGADVTLATPAVDWGGAWDYDYLAEHSDGLFVMAYGIHYKGSNPGPQLPMDSASPWNHKTLKWIVDDYFKWGKAANKHKFIFGLPLYGNKWPSASGAAGAKKLSNGAAVTMENAWSAAPNKGGWKYDAASKSAWYAYVEGGTWQQVWVETPNTFAFRTDYLDLRDVQLGLWALGYADKMNKVWQAIGDYQDAGGVIPPGPDAGGTDAGSPDAGPPDAGPADAGEPDAGPPDAGPADAGEPDAGPPDAGPPDAGKPDAGKPDAGPSDAGKPDAGQPDAGKPDAGPPDAGKIDAAAADLSTADSGAPEVASADAASGRTDLDAGAPAPGSGCSGGPRGRPAAPVWIVLLLAAAASRRRRSRV